MTHRRLTFPKILMRAMTFTFVNLKIIKVTTDIDLLQRISLFSYLIVELIIKTASVWNIF
jgi:hypothetical protein